MNKFCVCIIAAFLLEMVCYAKGTACNGFVDDVLNQLKQDREFFNEPYQISSEGLSVGIYNVEGGTVYGLNTLHRDGDARPYVKGSTTKVKVPLAAGELTIRCSMKRKMLHIGKPIEVKAVVPYAVMEVEIVPKADGSDPRVVGFSIEDIKGLKVKTTNMGVVKKLFYDAFLNMFARFFKGTIRTGIEERLTKFLENKVKDIVVPKECMEDTWESPIQISAARTD